MNIGLSDWILAFLISMILFTFIFGIPSVVAMYKLGFKAYRQQLRILRIMSRKISTGYKVTNNQGLIIKVETNHFFPIVVDKDHLIVLTKKEGTFNTLYIQYCEHKNDGWLNDNVEIKTSTCLLTQFLNDKFQKKVDNLMKNSVHIEGVENLNQLLNNQITSIKREEVLNSILNE